jgi:predicted phosphodiesterase
MNVITKATSVAVLVTLGLVMTAWAAQSPAAAPASDRFTIGPYVQNTSPTGATVMWFTENAVAGAVRYGVKPGEWLGTVTGPVTNAHVVAVTGLHPATKYFYEALDGDRPLAGGAEYYFQTHPKVGSRAPIRFLAAGDLNWGRAGRPWVDLATRTCEQVDFGMLLGDLTADGSHKRFVTDFFPTYGGLMRNLCLWACPGDNDFNTKPDAGGGGYATFFQFPTNDLPKVAGVFSFDYANAHFISLGDGCKNGVTKDDGIAWARRDLDEARQRGQKWIIAMNHRPVHDGKDSYAFCPELVELLEAGGVDVLLSGHSHFYKRTHLVNAGKVVQQNAASEYTKANDGTGTVYIITGTGGCTYDRPPKYELLTAFYLGATNGMTLIEIEGDTLQGHFLGIDGARHDRFQIRKSKP